MASKHQVVPLEIEKKFIIPIDIEARLDNLKAVKVKEVKYHDVYLDTADNCFALADMWLRRRNGAYELKYAPECKMESKVDQYQETADRHTIEQLLSAQLIRSGLDATANPQPTISLEDLLPFVELTTHRREYRLGENIAVVLDETNVGYNIGEVEVISLDPETRQQCVEDVERVIAQLQVQSAGPAESKVMRYLAEFNKPLLDKIRSKLQF